MVEGLDGGELDEDGWSFGDYHAVVEGEKEEYEVLLVKLKSKEEKKLRRRRGWGKEEEVEGEEGKKIGGGENLCFFLLF